MLVITINSGERVFINDIVLHAPGQKTRIRVPMSLPDHMVLIREAHAKEIAFELDLDIATDDLWRRHAHAIVRAYVKQPRNQKRYDKDIEFKLNRYFSV